MNLNEIFAKQIEENDPVEQSDAMILSKSYYDGTPREVGDTVLFFAIEREPREDEKIAKEEGDGTIEYFNCDVEIETLPEESELITEYESTSVKHFEQMQKEFTFVGVKDRLPTFQYNK